MKNTPNDVRQNETNCSGTTETPFQEAIRIIEYYARNHDDGHIAQTFLKKFDHVKKAVDGKHWALKD